MSSYSDRQIEVANLLNGAPAEVIDAVVAIIADVENDQLQAQAETTSEDTEHMIRMRLLDETDWRKRAALSALLISRSLS